MKRFHLAVLAAALFAAPAHAQPGQGELAYLRDYTFQRLAATRIVHDADDDGPIQLVTQVWKPVRNDRHEVAFFMHGSTGGLVTAPAETGSEGIPRALVQFLLMRGYTVVAPARRGRGFSTGKYIEECQVFTGACTREQQLLMTPRGVREAVLDNDAVLDQLVLGKLAPRGAKLLLIGHSRGGFLALVTAGEHPALVKGVINFAGGWLNPRDETRSDYRAWVDTQTVRLSRAAKQYAGPTMWVYSERDTNFTQPFKAELLRTWRDNGGAADYVPLTETSLPNPHLVHTVPALWMRQVDAFLEGIDGVR